MKKIEAIISPCKLDAVKDALSRDGIEGMTVSEVTGHGHEADQALMYRGASYAVDFHSKIKVEIAVIDDQVAAAVKILELAARTGKVGDGRIFVFPIEDAVRIRTGEHGVAAISNRDPADHDAPAQSRPHATLMVSAA